MAFECGYQLGGVAEEEGGFFRVAEARVIPDFFVAAAGGVDKVERAVTFKEELATDRRVGEEAIFMVSAAE